MTTNLPFGEWTKVFPDARMAKAVVDRLTHRAHIIDTGTESWRFRHGLQPPAKKGHLTPHARARAGYRRRVAGTVARPGSHRTVLVLFTHGSSGRRVVNPAAGRFQRP